MKEHHTKTWVEISSSALRHNIAQVRKIVNKNTKLLFVVKANAYGADIKTVVTITKTKVDWYGVDSIYEAKLVRKFCKNPILILGYLSGEEISEAIRRKFSVLVYNFTTLENISKKATGKNPAKVHIKIDTGLTRLGFSQNEIENLIKRTKKLPNIIVEGICTHYAKLVNKKHKKIYSWQLDKFRHSLNLLISNEIHPKFIHSASSVATFLFKDTHFNMVRVGIPIYGLWGKNSTLDLVSQKSQIKLSPVISFKTTVINIRKVKAGTKIGYGLLKTIKRDTTVAVLGAGFYDGIDKRFNKFGYVLINGKRVKILGTIFMNMCLADVSKTQTKIGDEAIIIGRSQEREITAYDFSESIGTSVYETISRINPLLPRIKVS